MVRSLLAVVAVSALAAPSGAPQDDPFETRIYNVEALTKVAQDDPGLSLSQCQDSIGSAVAVDEGRFGQISPHDLVALLQSHVAGGTWGNEKAKIEFTEGTLVVTNLRSVHEKVRQHLAYWRRFFGRVFVMDVALVAVDPPLLAKIRAEGNPDRPLALSPEQARQVLQAAREGKSGELLKTCRITAQPGQRVNLQDATRMAYIRDYDVQISTACGTLDPIVDVFSTGTSIDVRPNIDPFGGVITLEVRAEYVEPVGMEDRTLKLARDSTPLDPGHLGVNGVAVAPKGKPVVQCVEARIQLPRATVHRVRTTLAVKDRETAVVASPMRGGRNLLFLMTPCAAPIDEEPAPEPVPEEGRLLGIFSVSPCTQRLQDFAGPRLEVVSPQGAAGGGPLTGATFTLDEPVQHMSAENVVEMIKAKIAPGQWGDGRNSITVVGGKTLFIRQKPEVLREIGQFMDQLLRDRCKMITVEAAVVAFRKGSLAEWGREIPALAPGGLFADSEKVRKLLEEAFKGQQVRLLDMGEVTGFPRERVSMSRFLEEAYIMDFEPQVSTWESIFDPVIGILQSGFLLDVRPESAPGSDEVHMDLNAGLVRGEIREIPVVYAGGGPLHAPRQTGFHWRSKVTCVKGKWTVVGLESRGQGDAAEDVALLVRARPNLLR